MTEKNWSLGPQGTVTGILRDSVAQSPDKLFIEFQGGSRATYGEFNNRSNALARGLINAGVKAGDTVGVMLDSNLECVLSWFAVNKAGATWVPFNTALKGEFLRHQVDNAGAGIILAESDYAERFAAIEGQVDCVSRIFVRGDVLADGPRSIELLPLTTLYATDDSDLPECNQPSDLSMLIYTSGTTGPAKGCMISHNYAANMARLSRESADRGPEDVNWSCLPMFHLNATTTTVLATLLTSGRCYFMPRFSLSGFWSSIQASGATVVNIIGQMVPLIAKLEDTRESKACYEQVRAVMALPFDEHLQAVWRERFGITIAGANCYGLTEASLMMNLEAGEYAKPGSSGKRNEYFDVMVVDDDFNELPAGEAGEVVCRPRRPHIMFEGYWKNPQKTLEIMAGMWFHSGDIGKFDEDGFFFFVDRKKDYLRRGGENISSYELEVAIQAHPAVKEVAVHSVLSELSEDEVKATIVLADGAAITEEELCRWSVDYLPYYAVPRYIEFRGSLPINPLNKVMKYELRDEGVTPTTWDRNDSDFQLVKR